MSEYVRWASPAKGTPERTTLDDAWAAADKVSDGLCEDLAKAKTARDNVNRSTKRWEILDKRYRKLDDKYRAFAGEHKGLWDSHGIAILEDYAESGDEGQRMACAAEVLKRMGKPNEDPYPKLKELALAVLGNLTVTADMAESVAMDAASMVRSYPCSRTLTEQVRLSLQMAQRKAALRTHRDAVQALPYLDERRKGHWLRRLNDSEYEPDRFPELLKEAMAEDRDAHERRDEIYEHLRSLTDKGGSFSTDAVMDHFNSFSYNKATRSNRLPAEVKEIKIALKRLVMMGHAKVENDLLVVQPSVPALTT